MSSFAGVSVIADGELLRPPTSPTTASQTTGNGYHLLVIEGHSRTRTPIQSRYFMVGGHHWCISYNPDSISFRLHLCERTNGRSAVKTQFEFSFIDDTGRQKHARIHGTKICEFRGIGLESLDSAYVKFFEREALAKHLKNDSFTVRCDVVVVNHVIDVPVPPSDMPQNFTDLLCSGEGTDMVFQVGGELVSAHRCILAARSSVFRAMLFGPMKEGNPSTAGVIKIDDMDATVFKAMLGFIYGDSLSLPAVDDGGSLLQQLLVAADMYLLPRLEAICKKKLRELRKMYIFVEVSRSRLRYGPDHVVLKLKVSRDDTLASVKARLHYKQDIEPHRQRLVFAGSALPDDDEMTLADHGVGASSTIQLVETKMQVFVRMDKTITISDLASSDTVESFRARFQERTGILPAQQWLRYGGRSLEDGYTLGDYGINANSTLHFMPRLSGYRRAE